MKMDSKTYGQMTQKASPPSRFVKDCLWVMGTLVPITGFANAVVSPAIEFRSEGLVTGVGAKMFIIAGPVIVYGMLASVVWGVIYWAIRPLLGG